MSDPTGKRRPLGRGEWVAIVAAVVMVAAAVFAWVWKPSAPSPAANAADVPQASVPAAAADDAAPVVEDPEARASLESLSSDPAFQRWLAVADDLVRRWATATTNVAEGASPRKALDFLAPKGAFAVQQRGGRTVIAPAAYARYDELAAAVASIDADAFARVYQALHPALEGAYRGLGYPGGSFDAVTARALSRIETAPVADGDVAVTADRGAYKFADPKLEGLHDVEKHLLRMGPKNERIVQAKAKQLREALQLQLPAEMAAH
jgi:Protein of unknown function (DUF3014)